MIVASLGIRPERCHSISAISSQAVRIVASLALPSEPIPSLACLIKCRHIPRVGPCLLCSLFIQFHLEYDLSISIPFSHSNPEIWLRQRRLSFTWKCTVPSLIPVGRRVKMASRQGAWFMLKWSDHIFKKVIIQVLTWIWDSLEYMGPRSHQSLPDTLVMSRIR